MSTPNPPPLRAILLGQALIKRDLRALNPAHFRQLAGQCVAQRDQGCNTPA